MMKCIGLKNHWMQRNSPFPIGKTLHTADPPTDPHCYQDVLEGGGGRHRDGVVLVVQAVVSGAVLTLPVCHHWQRCTLHPRGNQNLQLHEVIMSVIMAEIVTKVHISESLHTPYCIYQALPDIWVCLCWSKRQIYSALPDFWDGPSEHPCWRSINLCQIPGDLYP